MNLEDPAKRIDQSCGSSSAKNRFAIAGRGGLPTSPTDAFTGNQPLVELAEPQVEWFSTQASVSFTSAPGTLMPAVATTSATDQIVEAQSWVKAADGSVYLVTQAATATPHAGWQGFLKCSAGRSPILMHGTK